MGSRRGGCRKARPVLLGGCDAGALRGLGPAGLELERLHGLAEACGKAQAGVALALIALHVVTLGGADAAKPAEVAVARSV